MNELCVCHDTDGRMNAAPYARKKTSQVYAVWHQKGASVSRSGMTYQKVPRLHQFVAGLQETALQAQLETAQLLKRWPRQS